MAKKNRKKPKTKFTPRYLGSALHPFKKPRTPKVSLEKESEIIDGMYVATAKNDVGEILFTAKARSYPESMQRLDAKIEKGHTIEVEKLLAGDVANHTIDPGRKSERQDDKFNAKQNDSKVPHDPVIPLDLSLVSNKKLKELFDSLKNIENEQLRLDIEDEYNRRLGVQNTQVQLKTGIENGVDNSTKQDHLEYFDTANVKVRKKQGLFRASLFSVYGQQCMVTGTSVIEVLEAAHIIPVSISPDDRTENGLVLRADIHKLYDSNKLRINGNYTVSLDECIQDSFYCSLNGKTIASKTGAMPSKVKLTKRFKSQH